MSILAIVQAFATALTIVLVVVSVRVVALLDAAEAAELERT
jgi:hypothetical protein